MAKSVKVGDFYTTSNSGINGIVEAIYSTQRSQGRGTNCSGWRDPLFHTPPWNPCVGNRITQISYGGVTVCGPT